MDPLYLVDGSGYIFRAYYAVQPLSTSRGFPTNALLGFTRMLTKLLRDVGAKYIAVAFDAGKTTFRNELYAEYKANRRECPEDLVPQLPYFRKIVEAFGIECLEKSGAEADDVIATITKQLNTRCQRIVIVSGDKDLTQLVASDVHVWDAMRDILYDREKVREKFGVFPEQIIDYLALVGDTSDNVPGVKGIGPKTAERLLQHFENIDRLLENTSEISTLSGLRGANSIREKIESSPDSLRLSLELVRLKTDVEPFNQVEDVEAFAWRQAKPEILGPLFEELEFESLSDVVAFVSQARAQTQKPQSELRSAKDYRIVSAGELPAFAAQVAALPEFAFDTETTSLDCLDCSLIGISISFEPDRAFYLPLACSSAPEMLLDSAEVRRLLGPAFANPAIKKFGFNLKFDIGVLERHGYTVNGASFDGLICAHLLNPDRRTGGLKQLARACLNEEMAAYEDVVGDCEHLAHVELQKVADYACHDADASLKLKIMLDSQLGERAPAREPSLRGVFEDVEMPLVPVLSRMERIGLRVDLRVLDRLGEQFCADIRNLEAQIYELAGSEFNLNSPKQVGAVLFERLGLPATGIKKTASGFSTDASVLSKLAERYPIAARLLEYRELHKLNSTYVEALKRLVNPQTGRIHTSFNQTITATGRLSSSEPNLQNIPIRNPRGRQIREAFVAEDGKVLITADYSQIELRILAHMSGDETLRQAFASGEDIHLRTASEIFGELQMAGAERKALRRAAKTINFGIIYGMGAFRLARELGVTRRQAQDYIDSYFARYPKVLEYFDRLKRDAETLGYVTTMFGRRRYADELDTTGRDAGYTERSMMNAPIQGSAAEVMKIAMINLHRRLIERLDGCANIVLQVHDELVVEADEANASEAAALVVSEMEDAVNLAVPLKVDLRVHQCWGELSS